MDMEPRSLLSERSRGNIRTNFETMRATMITIPPRSLLLERGDLPHAGAGGRDHLWTDIQLPPARLHVYITRNHNTVLGDRVGDEDVDSIHLLPDQTFLFPSDYEEDPKVADEHINRNDVEHNTIENCKANHVSNGPELKTPKLHLTVGETSNGEDASEEHRCVALVDIDDYQEDSTNADGPGPKINSFNGSQNEKETILNQTGPCCRGNDCNFGGIASHRCTTSKSVGSTTYAIMERWFSRILLEKKYLSPRKIATGRSR